MRAVLSALLLLLPALASAVDVQGALPAADTVWKKNLSPYVLTGDVTVPWGAKLTVEAGVQIIAIPEDGLGSGVDVERVELIVDGTLVVRGTPSQPVEFTSHGRPGSWYGIRVRGGRGTVIDGARIHQATQGISLGMSATVKNTSVSALAQDCIQVTWGRSSLQANDVNGCGGRERGAPVRPMAPDEPRSQDNWLATGTPSSRGNTAPPAPPASRQRPSVLPPPEPPRTEPSARRTPVQEAPAPRLSRPLPSTVDAGDCAIEPQVNEPPECPGIRQWRKNQERLSEADDEPRQDSPRRNTPTTSGRQPRGSTPPGGANDRLRVAPDTRRQDGMGRSARP
ncbi:right-handed parallel beta-helix repeat-containing protein [Cystobacter ferrugineus]|uniref:Uncharacterized protein n=1 Tax=Cystobacter ferrugineus TaxID=83449 RepID=A0A1L9BCT5_9BACT|nr:right-handed parallel beta-helix repeat-containing protein [Cystobacter ferrugineus]OJH40059.1 hypothetical protein BON30_13400 [Cystobacter ferrugineus]